jgi:hypothetical protein
MRPMRSRACGLWIAGLLSAPVLAGFTTLQAPPSGEFTHKQIFECTYGGTFTPSGLNFSNGTITATRVDDNGFVPNLNMLTGSPGTGDDDIWTDGIATCTAEARFAGFTQEFGYRVTSFGYVKLFDVSSSGCAASGGPATVTFGGTAPTWEWARADDSDSGLSNPHYSDEPSNSDGLDHMVTYAITGIPSVPVTTKVWAVFFEDVNGSGSDRDFNDLMVEIRAVHCVTNADCFSDGIFCDGNEVCLNGVCTHSGDPCSGAFPVCCEGVHKCEAECCSDADCPTNGIFCDGPEICHNGSCVSAGNPCVMGRPVCCESLHKCEGECCSDADCQAPTPPCEGGEFCNMSTGMCESRADAPVTTTCESDGDRCTVDHCDGLGQCVFLSDVICQSPNPPCEGGEVCNPSTGLCVAQPDAALSTPCEADGNLCTIDHCNGSGSCVQLSTVVCLPSVGPCDAGSHCNPADGQCVNNPDPPFSTPCNADNDLCTIEHCDGNGSCVPLGHVTCQPANPPCEGGETCDPATGMCVAQPDAVLSTPCEADGNRCTIDHCNGMGACVKLGDVMCQAANPPCEGGEVCDPGTGACVAEVDAASSTPCEADGDLCTIDHCDGLGACVFLSSVPCQPAVPPCEGGEVCNPSTGLCVAQPDAVLSTPCEAESPADLCTIDHCNGQGQCVHLSDVVCQPPNPPCEGGEQCNPTTGVCVHLPDAVLSTPCELDGNLCTVDHCNGKGLCVFLVCKTPGITCPPDKVFECDAVGAFGVPIVDDTCSVNPSAICTEESTPGKLPQERTIIRTCTVTNDCGNSAMCQQRIDVVDTTAPVVTCPPDCTLECGDVQCVPPECGDPSCECGGVATCEDNCSTCTVSVTCEVIPKGCIAGQVAGLTPPPKLTVVRTFSSIDGVASATATGQGNIGTCVQHIELVDTTPPVLDPVICSRPITICVGADLAAFTPPTCTDTCGTCSVICVRSDNQPFPGPPPNGPITVTCVSSDECGNESSCDMDVELSESGECFVNIPTVSEWGLLVLTLLLLTGGKIGFGRRQAETA